MESQNSFTKAKLALAVASAMLAPQVIAQDTPDDEGGLEVIEITAQKRLQSLQEVGLSVTALSEKDLERAGVSDVSRLELVTPGVAFGFIGSDAKVAIRGANSNNTFGDNSSIAGFFADGVYRPRASQQSQAYFDVSRIEILKGPQGTLYGRNTFAGAINLTTNAASLDGFDAGVKLGLHRFDKQRVETFINQPINDEVAVRLAVQTLRSNGHIENLGPAGNLGQDDSYNYRLSAYFEPTDNLNATVRYTSINQKGTTPGIFSAEGLGVPINENGITDVFGTIIDFSNPAPGTQGTVSAFNRPNVVSYDVENKRDNQEDNITVEVNLELDAVTLKSITSYTDFTSAFDFDGDFSANPGYVYFWDEAVESVTQELQISSNTDSDLFWTAGLYFSDDAISFGFSQYRTSSYEAQQQFTDENGNTFPIFNGTALIDPFGGANFSDFADFQEIDVETIGVFFQGEYSVNEDLTLIAGIRYNEEEKSTTTSFGTARDGNGNLLRGATPFGLNMRPVDFYDYTVAADRSGSETFDIVTWKVGFNYSLNDDSMIYGTGSTGFLSGGLNSNGSSFDQQESEAWELGMKNRLLDNSLQVNFAFYINEFSDLITQRLTFPEPDTAITISENAGTIDVTGFELEFDWLPTDNIFVNGSLSLMDAEYDTFGVSNPFQLNNGVPSSQVNNGFLALDGTTPPWSPEYTYHLGIGYEIELEGGSFLTPYLQFYYSDGYNTDDVSLYSTQVQDSYGKTDFRLTWTSEEENISIELFVENIEDEAVLARTNIGGNNLIQGSYLYPRNYGINLNYRFE